ncbi:3036_t:CDS:2 [Cetraspora pellucida]|uniref:3036_t:CDS:1 n=1 Tax=Cetraspora pellucida TaxID=1433469 RepID=A0A9N9G0U7_9GLOM|nr:3036_t:CDS:2 [Cetraspora pellucida]
MLIEKAKALANGLGVLPKTLQFSHSWLQKFKEKNDIRQIKLQGEAASADNDAIANILLLLKSNWEEVNPKTIYNYWKHTNILPTTYNADLQNLSENIPQDSAELDDLSEMVKNINFSDPMHIEEFLTIPEEKITYEIPENIRSLKNL